MPAPSHSIRMQQDFAASPEEVFARLIDHDGMGAFFSGSFRRIRAAEAPDGNGAGAVRRVGVGPFPAFEETVLLARAPHRIEYSVTKGGPIQDHLGVIEIAPRDDGGCRVDYRIDFSPRLPGMGWLLAIGLKNGIQGGLKKLARQLEARKA